MGGSTSASTTESSSATASTSETSEISSTSEISEISSNSKPLVRGGWIDPNPDSDPVPGPYNPLDCGARNNVYEMCLCGFNNPYEEPCDECRKEPWRYNFALEQKKNYRDYDEQMLRRREKVKEKLSGYNVLVIDSMDKV